MININLIAAKRAQKLREMQVTQLSTLAVLVVIGVMLALNGWALFENRLAKHSNDRASEVLMKKQAAERKLNETIDKIRAELPTKKLLEKAHLSERAWMTILGDISQVTPEDISLSTLSTSSGQEGVKLHLIGYAKDEDTLGAYIIALKTSPHNWAMDIKSGGITAEEKEGGLRLVRFDLTVGVRGMYGGEM